MATPEYFGNFQAYTIFTFVMPEYAASTGNINKHFRMDEILEKLRTGNPLNRALNNFDTATPVSNFKAIYKNYEERFWTLFWRQAPTKLPAHFPMLMMFQGQLGRAQPSSNSQGNDNLTVASYRAELECHFFPYGAISLRLHEYVYPGSQCTTQQMVDFLNRDLLWDGESYTLKSFFQELRESILSQVIKKRLNIPYSGTSPQYQVIFPNCEKCPDRQGNWRDMATLLAMSGQDNYLSKYDAASYPNYGKNNQEILIGPRSCVVFAPLSTFHNKMDGPDCLNRRLVNLSELCIIQNEFINKFIDDYAQLCKVVEATANYSLKEVEQAIRNEFSYGITDSIIFLKLIMSLQDPLALKAQNDSDVQRWLNWYQAVFNAKKTSIDSFLAVLDRLNKANVKLHDDVKKSISGLIKTILQFKK